MVQVEEKERGEYSMNFGVKDGIGTMAHMSNRIIKKKCTNLLSNQTRRCNVHNGASSIVFF